MVNQADPRLVRAGRLRILNRTLLPHHQSRKITYPAALPLNTAYKNSSPKLIRNFEPFEQESPFSLPGPAISLSLLQTPAFPFVWPYCVSSTQTPVTQFSRVWRAWVRSVKCGTVVALVSTLQRSAAHPLPPFYTGVPGRGHPTKSQGFFWGRSEFPGQREEDNCKEERDCFLFSWREFYLRAENSRNAERAGAFRGGLKAPPCRSPQKDFNSFHDVQTWRDRRPRAGAPWRHGGSGSVRVTRGGAGGGSWALPAEHGLDQLWDSTPSCDSMV